MYLTKRQKEVYDFIRSYRAKKGYSPTQREIADYFGWTSLGTVQKFLKSLINKGQINKDFNRVRSIGLVPAEVPAGLGTVDILGTVSAGEPIRVFEDREEYSIDTLINGSENIYALRVSGSSMIDDGIRDGDIILVKRVMNAEQGQTVIALVNGEATVKKFYRRQEKIELRPANPRMKPIFLREEEIIIQGVVVGLIRQY
jgi:repressor LexA